MKINIFCLIVLSVIVLFASQGCASSSHMTSNKGIVKVGMTKVEVLAVWGEPEKKSVLGEEYVQGIQLGTAERWELWRYPRMTWWAAHGVDLAFDKGGVLTSIEPLIK